ncbi:hypothetical protein M2317_000818 [Microbacterium sp. ZKA21]
MADSVWPGVFQYWFDTMPTIAGGEVGLPPNTFYIDADTGQVYRTVS